MKIRFTLEAQEELNSAIDYYSKIYPRLGQRYKETLQKATLKIAEAPEAWPVIQAPIRKYVLHEFPYNILYTIDHSNLLILAIAHQHRQPGYGLNRSGA